MADVLLSLKHAVLKPSPDPQQMHSSHHHQGMSGAGSSAGYGNHQSPYGHHPQASLSYTVHPQMLGVSPNAHHLQSQMQNGGSGGNYATLTNGNLNGGGGGGSLYYDSPCQHPPQSAPPPPPPSMYPSMSVNVSMNMTMHGYGGAEANVPMQCSQVCSD